MPNHKESKIQQGIVKYLRTLGYYVFACPNGGYRGSIIEASIMKSEGVLAGVSDLVIVLPEGRVVFVEIKTPDKASKQTDTQIEFQRRVEGLGHTYLLWRTFDDAINWHKSHHCPA